MVVGSLRANVVRLFIPVTWHARVEMTMRQSQSEVKYWEANELREGDRKEDTRS